MNKILSTGVWTQTLVSPVRRIIFRAVGMSKKTARTPKLRIKRMLDLIICVIGMPLILPLGLLLALLVYIDNPKAGPIYRHQRLGKDGKTFKIYKFRTMVPDADSMLESYLQENPEYAEEWKQQQKLKHDPRLTTLGRFLRKYSLDELPQIINILEGDMTLVGPRPIVANETYKYGRYFEEYCLVRPGLTGLWQTSGRNNTTYAQRVAYDHFYINNWSIWLDLWILAKTVPAALSGNGAY